MERTRVTLADHDPRWSDAYEQVASAIREALPGATIELHHVGSTSIPGLRAKPILDVMGAVPSIEAFDSYQATIEALGFSWKGEYGIPGRRYCVLYDPAGKIGFVHLHVHAKDHPGFRQNLLFRDCLRQDPEAAARYGELKERLRSEFENRRERYTEAKRSFIESILAAGDMSAATDEDFLRAFETCRLPKVEWTHRAHVRMAWLYLRAHGPEAALSLIRANIRRYNAAVGGPPGAYHETVTQAYVRIVHARMRQPGSPQAWREFEAAHPDLFDRASPPTLRYYRRETLSSHEAHASFVAPDLEPLP